jgi:hypothetical protein
MMRNRLTDLAPASILPLATLLLLAPACSNSQTSSALGGSSVVGTGGTMSIVSCSLGCNTFQSSQVSCNLNDVFVNEEIRIEFSQAVDLSSLNQGTFQVQETITGLVPPGTFSADPSKANGIIYRPLLTFDSSGSPVFGLQQGLSYEIFLPGANEDAGPFITSVTGRPLGTRMRCIVTAGGGINDPVAGAPTVDVRVNLIEKDGLGNPVPPVGVPNFGASVLADNSVDVHRRSNITFNFNDIMNPATLVNPVTKQSPSIRVFVDPDGDVTDPTDQVELFGQFQIVINQDQLTTTVTFDPDTEFPSAGPVTQTTPRRIVVSLPTSIVDLGGNSIANANSISFVPERLQFTSERLSESFVTAQGINPNEDLKRSGAFWGPTNLRPGFGGGSGRLGDLALGPGEVLTLYTDGKRPKISPDGMGHEVDAMGVEQFVDQLFGPAELVHQTGILESAVPLPGNAGGMPASVALTRGSVNVTTALLDNYDNTPPVMGNPPPSGQTTFSVTDGIFEFASLTLEAGTVLRFVGPSAPRVFVRGEAAIRGRIEVNGTDASQSHDSSSFAGGVGAAGGPGGGRGGDGGIRPDGGMDLMTIGGQSNPLWTSNDDIDGNPGAGFPFPGEPQPVAGGSGGTRWPDLALGDMPPIINPTLDAVGGVVFNPLDLCASPQVGGAGGGGGRATDGGIGQGKEKTPLDPMFSVPPDTPGGSFLIPALDPARTLAPEKGFLVGGAAGGGAGGHVRNTFRGGNFFTGCTLAMLQFHAHSGAAGGGGGGALQVQAGGRMTVDGVIDASGGRGGQPLTAGTDPSVLQKIAASPGGSGAGGSILLQTLNLKLSQLAGRLVVPGGPQTTGIQGFLGGTGGTGLVRVEAGNPGNNSVPVFDNVARAVNPVDTLDLPASSAWLSVEPNGWERLQIGGVLNLLHPLTGDPLVYLPDGMSGSQSCWLQPEGNFFRLTFEPDDSMAGTFGWDMKVVLPGVSIDYRAQGFESQFQMLSMGGLLSELQDPTAAFPALGSPFIVRFQGARAIKEISDLCNVPLSGSLTPIQPDSLTPWVLHPAELNDYWDLRFPTSPGEVSKRRPNMIRYQIVMNRTAAIAAGLNFVGIDDVFVDVTPD